MKYLSGITLLIILFSSHAIACEKMDKNKSASVLKLESSKTTQVESSPSSDKNLIVDESSFTKNIKNSVGEGEK